MQRGFVRGCKKLCDSICNSEEKWRGYGRDIRNTTSQIGDKIEVKREIDTLLAAKKYEFQIMSMVPYGIIAYMSLSFSDFMEELYGNVTGIGVMTLCLGIYVALIIFGVRLLRIDV